MNFILLATVLLAPGIKPDAQCPRPILININLRHSIDRGVFKRTYFKCRRHYKKSPCLIKLNQTQKGAFEAICGEKRIGLSQNLSVSLDDPDIFDDTTLSPSCSSAIFEHYLAEDWASYQSYPVVIQAKAHFCETLGTAPLILREWQE